MRIFPAIIAFSIPCSAFAQATPETKAVAIGPWQIEASFLSGDKFDRCVMSRTTDDQIEIRFTRDEGGLTLSLTSPRWKLEEGKTYPVEFAADAIVWKSDVAATSNAVRVPLADARFNRGLSTGNRLEIRAAGATIRVPLNRSSAALARLESCYATNSTALETNPFVKPELKP